MAPNKVFDTAFILSVLNLPQIKGQPQVFNRVSTDSRSIQPGDLFVALKGDQFDGNDFTEKAISAGASGVLISRPRSSSTQSTENVQEFLVQDTLQAYRAIAAAWRKQFTIPVVAVAGSVGKTTTKEILAAMLRGKFTHVLNTEKSQNGFIGIPMTLLKLRPEHQAAVIEVGIDALGAMKAHLEIVRPTASVVTAIGPEHLEHLKTIENVALEETECLRFVAQERGLIAINLDDTWILSRAQELVRSGKFKGTGFTLQEQPRSNFGNLPTIKGDLKNTLDQLELRQECHIFPGAKFQLPLPGTHNASNFLAALSLAHGLGLTIDEIRKGLETFAPPQGRNEIHQLPNGATIICDYYNSNPSSLEAALRLLSQLQGSGAQKKIAILGDMLELGEREEQFHRAVAKILRDLGIENVFLYGDRMKHLQEELSKPNPKPVQVKHFTNSTLLAKALKPELNSTTTALIKGSRSMRMETIFEELKTQ